MTEKRIIHWWEDSSGRRTCHLNQPGVLFEQSLLGYVEKRDGKWYYVCLELVDGSNEFENGGPYNDVYKACKALEETLNAIPLRP